MRRSRGSQARRPSTFRQTRPRRSSSLGAKPALPLIRLDQSTRLPWRGALRNFSRLWLLAESVDTRRHIAGIAMRYRFPSRGLIVANYEQPQMVRRGERRFPRWSTEELRTARYAAQAPTDTLKFGLDPRSASLIDDHFVYSGALLLSKIDVGPGPSCTLAGGSQMARVLDR
jgi:hypothetical protein